MEKDNPLPLKAPLIQVTPILLAVPVVSLPLHPITLLVTNFDLLRREKVISVLFGLGPMGLNHINGIPKPIGGTSWSLFLHPIKEQIIALLLASALIVVKPVRPP